MYTLGIHIMNLGHIESIGTTISGEFLAGILIDYAFKKVLKLVAVVVGLFFAGLAYLQYQHIVNINWNKLQATSQNTVTTFTNVATQIPGFNNSSAVHTGHCGIMLAGSMSMGFAIGFMKGRIR